MRGFTMGGVKRLLFFAALALAAVAFAQYRSKAPYKTEEEAVAKAVEIGAGSARLLGADAAVVGTFGEFTIRFTVGQAGMRTGGGLRIATAHDFRWDMWGGTRLQTDDPKAANFLTFKTSTGARLRWTPYPQGGEGSLFSQYHPWQTINEFQLEGEALRAGDWISITFGDRSGGSPGVETQPMDETAFEQKIYVDSFGEGEYLPLPENPVIRVLAGEAKELKVVAQTDWVVGEAGWVNVWFDDGLGNPAEGVSETVLLTLRGQAAELARRALTLDDRAAYRFEELSFDRPGTYRIEARTLDGRLRGLSNPFVVHPDRPEKRIYWGDLHTHTRYSDGRGTPAEMYEFGKRIAAIDFCAVSDHAFTTTDAMWDDTAATAERYNEPGRYVTFLGYEWSGRSDVGGDHNVYTVDPRMPLIRSYNGYDYRNLRMYHGPNKMAGHVEDLFRMLAENYRDENLLVIPHFGGRPGNPSWHNDDLQRGVEIFSDHRRSEDWATRFLEKGYRIGVMASTDNHSGNAGYGVRRVDITRGEEGEVYSRFSPAERGTALMAVLAENLARESVFQGVYHRRTYATTGERIILRFRIGDIEMGSEGAAPRRPRIDVEAVGTALIATVRIVKDGKVIHATQPGAERAAFAYLDAEGASPGSYYYVDLVQVDGEKAISSPIWLD